MEVAPGLCFPTSTKAYNKSSSLVLLMHCSFNTKSLIHSLSPSNRLSRNAFDWVSPNIYCSIDCAGKLFVKLLTLPNGNEL